MSEHLVPPPTTDDVKRSRKAAGLTQHQANMLLGHSSERTWRNWEHGVSRPSVAAWTLWLLLTDQHPALRLTSKA